MARNGEAAERSLEKPHTWGTLETRCPLGFALIPLSQNAQSPPNSQVDRFANHLEHFHADLSVDEIDAAKTAWIEAHKEAIHPAGDGFVFLPFSLSPPLTWPTNFSLPRHCQAHPYTDPMEEDDPEEIIKQPKARPISQDKLVSEVNLLMSLTNGMTVIESRPSWYSEVAFASFRMYAASPAAWWWWRPTTALCASPPFRRYSLMP